MLLLLEVFESSSALLHFHSAPASLDSLCSASQICVLASIFGLTQSSTSSVGPNFSPLSSPGAGKLQPASQILPKAYSPPPKAYFCKLHLIVTKPHPLFLYLSRAQSWVVAKENLQPVKSSFLWTCIDRLCRPLLCFLLRACLSAATMTSVLSLPSWASSLPHSWHIRLTFLPSIEALPTWYSMAFLTSSPSTSLSIPSLQNHLPVQHTGTNPIHSSAPCCTQISQARLKRCLLGHPHTWRCFDSLVLDILFFGFPAVFQRYFLWWSTLNRWSYNSSSLVSFSTLTLLQSVFHRAGTWIFFIYFDFLARPCGM